MVEHASDMPWHKTSLLDFALGFPFTQTQVDKLSVYMDRIWLANQQLNLFSRKMSAEALFHDHLLDCLAALPYVPNAKKVADLGSGGGLPAIPLAICFPNTQFLLFEKSPKKRLFLESLSDVCPNISIQGLIEPHSIDQNIDWVTARAFKPIGIIVELTRAYANAGGQYFLYKGRRNKIEEELKTAKLGRLQSKIQPLPIFGSADERHLVLLKP